MQDFLATIALLSMILTPAALIVWAIQALRKKPTKAIKRTSIILPVIFVLCFAISVAISCDHEWRAATCTEAKTCELCGRISGEPLGHQWNDATCSLPRTCDVCSERQGEALGHDWVEGSCLLPKTCVRCKATVGDPLGHNWNEATCTAPKTCSTCSATIGEVSEHIYGTWKIEIEATESTPGKRVRYCMYCQKEEKESYEFGSIVSFNFTKEEFAERVSAAFALLDCPDFGGAPLVEIDGETMIAILDSENNTVGNIKFATAENVPNTSESQEENDFLSIVLITNTTDEILTNSMLATIMSLNPTLDEIGALQLAIQLLSTDAITNAGINYFIFTMDGYFYMMAAPA